MGNNQTSNAQSLIEFLKKIDIIEYLGNLPAILLLQKKLGEKFTGRIALSDVEEMTIRDFYHKVDDTFKEQFQQLSEVLLQTWNSLADKVKSFGGIMAAELAKLNMFDKHLDPGNTPAAFLFPASHGTGLCSYALAMLLIDTHNTLVRSDLPPINPYNAGAGHLATLTKSQVQTMLLAHTRYYLQKNGITKEEYDIESMDRRIKERYVQGRPRLLDNELPRIQFLEDRSGSEQRLLSSRMRQEELSNNTQYQIETEVKSLPDLCQLLESVYTAEDLVLGDPCCPGSACLSPPLSDSPNSFCQYIDKITDGGFCGDHVGICEDGSVCVADTCTKVTTTATTTPPTTVSGDKTVAEDCAATDAVCFSDTVDIKPCCITTDICRHDESDPAGTYKCQTDCTQSNKVCYDGTAPPKSCCDSADKCLPDPTDTTGTKVTCHGTYMDSGETCFDPGLGNDPPAIKSCCNPEAECVFFHIVGICN